MKYETLTQCYQAAGERLKALDDQLLERRAKRDRLLAYMNTLRKQGEIEAFDEGLWNATVETVTVNHDGTLLFHWKDGNESVWKG